MNKTSITKAIKHAIILLSGIFFALGVSAFALAESNQLKDIRFGVKKGEKTRIVFDFSNDIEYRVATKKLSSNRILISAELLDASSQEPLVTEGVVTGKGLGIVKSYAVSDGEGMRKVVSLQLTGRAVPFSVFKIKPKGKNKDYRLVIDVEKATETAFKTALTKVYGSLEKADATIEDVTLAQITQKSDTKELTDKQRLKEAINALGQDVEKAGDEPSEIRQVQLLDKAPVPRIKPDFWKPTIVVDAGHGGKDPGSVGQGGLLEKTVNLAAAKELQKILKKRGYKVIMTRDGDTYPENEERIALARQKNADLFISIHADSVGDHTVSGGSVYTLSRKGETRLTNQVLRQGDFVFFGKDLKSYDDEVSAMVLDIAATDSRNVSSKFANILISKLKPQISLVKNNHREANYVVLLSPDVPAVLLELGFISNSNDEKNLNSKAWRKKAVTAVADSIDAYFEDVEGMQQALIAGGAR